MLHWSRPAFVATWSGLVLLLAGLCIRVEGIGLRTQLRRHWKAGVWLGLIIGGMLMVQVFGQPASAGLTGWRLGAALAGYGVIYGLVDALVLSIIPVLTLYGGQPAEVLQSPSGRVGWAGVALVASGLITASYHAGFAEFRGSALVGPVIGNLVVTLGYLLSGSPVAAFLSHILMHVAAVLRGMESTTQLPPH